MARTRSEWRLRLPPPRLLIADPDDACRFTYRSSFEREVVDFVEVTDGHAALVSALARRPSLVLTELHLPSLDGVALCEILRRDHATATVPILMVTAEPEPAALDRARQAGVDTVLRKPITREIVRFEVDRLLRATRQYERAQEAARRVARQVDASAERIRRSRMLTRGAFRYRTTSAPNVPPGLVCADCDRPLVYQETFIGGVNEQQAEQWDYFRCPRCSTQYQYRQRTRRIRRVK